jgi:(p)ppGpp synthase/HD superfamily hydrolase
MKELKKYLALKKKYLNNFNNIYKISKNIYKNKKIFNNINLLEYILSISDNLLIYNDNILFSSMLYNIYRYKDEEYINKLDIDSEILKINEDYYYFNFPQVLFLNNFNSKNYNYYIIQSFTKIESFLLLFSECLVIFKYYNKIKNKNIQNRFLRLVKNSIIPLSSRLGMYKYKNKIQESYIKIKYPKKYEILNKEVNKYYSKEALISIKDKVINIVCNKNNKIKIEDISYRYKSIASIFENIYIRKKGKNIKNINDIYAIRFIVENKKDCYKCAKIIKDNFKLIKEKNYIKKPKSNNYKTIHLNIIVNNYVVEIQIRTKAMHENAEYGIASHFKYKFENYAYTTYDKKLIEIVRNYKYKKRKKISTKISVFTKDNKKIDIPKGTTLLEFGFYLHSDLVTFFDYAIVNNKVVYNKNYKLKNLDNIKIIKSYKITLNKEDLKYITNKKNRSSFKYLINKYGK